MKVYIVNASECNEGRDWLDHDEEKFKEEARRQGNIYTLLDFQDAINNEELFLDNSWILFGE